MSQQFYPIVHLAIDVQPEFLNRMHLRRRKAFPQSIRSFADAIAPEIPTIWVAFGNGFELYSHTLTSWTQHREMPMKQKHGVIMPFGLVGTNEDILVKGQPSAFDDPLLLNHLRGLGTAALILTGFYSLGCVHETAQDALTEDFDCVIVTNLLADYDPVVDNLNRYKSRERLLRELLTEWSPAKAERTHLTTSRQLLKSLKEKPALLKRTAPVSQLLVATA